MAVDTYLLPLSHCIRRVVIGNLIPEFKQGKIRQVFEGGITFFPKEKKCQVFEGHQFYFPNTGAHGKFHTT